MSELHQNLKKVRRILPNRYGKQLAERIDGIEHADVKKAFAGQLANEEKLTLILAEAVKWAGEIKRSRRRVKMKVQKLTGTRRKG